MDSYKLPAHFFAYSGLLGVSCYQSFFAGITAYKALPIEMFSKLQHRIFPGYFTIQTALSALLLLTAPFKLSQTGLASLGVSFVGGAFNLAIVMPSTSTIISKREELMEREGKSYKDPTASDEMKALNKRFAKFHGISMLANLAVIIATIVYGFTFTSSLTPRA